MSKLESRKAELLKEASRELRSRVEIERQKDVQELLDEEAVDYASAWSFIFYVSRKILDNARRRKIRRPNLDFVSGRGFDDAGVRTGDFIYVLTAIEGDLFLVGRMQVGEYLDYDQAKSWFKGTPRLEEYLSGRQGTRIRFDRKLRSSVVRNLRFYTKGSNDVESAFGLKFIAESKVDIRALRGIRRLTSGSAALLGREIARRHR